MAPGCSATPENMGERWMIMEHVSIFGCFFKMFVDDVHVVFLQGKVRKTVIIFLEWRNMKEQTSPDRGFLSEKNEDT